MNAIWIVLPILTLLMFELGLTLQTEDFKLFRKRPRPIIAGLARSEEHTSELQSR